MGGVGIGTNRFKNWFSIFYDFRLLAFCSNILKVVVANFNPCLGPCAACGEVTSSH